MDILFLLIPLSLLLVFAIIYAIWWAVNSGQFENVEKHGDEILYDDDGVHTPKYVKRHEPRTMA